MRENTEYERKYAAKEDECDLLKAHLETSFQAERAKFGDMEKRYMQQINKLKAELDDLVDFKNAKQDHEHELEEARNARELERKSYKDTLYEMEREGARERERLRKEKDEEIGLIKQTLLRLTQRKLDTSTKMTMVENDQVARELKQQAKQTLNLLNESKQLKDEVQQLRQKLDIMTGLQDEMAHKTQVQHSLIKTLLAKLKKEQRRTADAEARASSAPVSAGAATQGGRQRVGMMVSLLAAPGGIPAPPHPDEDDGLREKIGDLELEVTDLRGIIASQNTELASAREQLEKLSDAQEKLDALLATHDEATWFLLGALEDSRELADMSDLHLTMLAPDQREKMLKFFLSKLHTYKVASEGGIVEDFVEPVDVDQTERESIETYTHFAAPFESVAAAAASGVAGPIPIVTTEAPLVSSSSTPLGYLSPSNTCPLIVTEDSTEDNT
eukprot:TRINITY_DN605_c0_g1_i3.p1 TRINITY_DN605_c0_g1~~TRINITY_DN605_c0_g1_i3.p1  ORF type:complete len:444 (+),score=138.09 TRINITY_DN605_c0_g1_i3:331-1662(+)